MRRHIPTLQDVQRVTRVRVCADCPYRTPGTDAFTPDDSRPCEADCPLFGQLGGLRQVARQLEPMVGNRPRVLSRILASIKRRPFEASNISRRNRRRVLELIDELFEA